MLSGSNNTWKANLRTAEYSAEAQKSNLPIFERKTRRWVNATIKAVWSDAGAICNY